MKLFNILVSALLFASPLAASAHKGHHHPGPVDVPEADIDLSTPWCGKRVAYLGDSMTDPKNNSSKAHYWDYLTTLSGIEPEVFARSGFEWGGIYTKAEELKATLSDSIDAVIIWAGTNDYNHSRPIGKFYSETIDSVNVNGEMQQRLHRTFLFNDSTFTGNINRTLAFLKHNYPDKQIIIMTPIHRGYAKFNDHNVQPDENYANGQGLYIEDYVDTLVKGARLWSVPVIDLYSDSGLFPMEPEHVRYFHHGETDLLHPNDIGHYRIARLIQSRLSTLPTSF